MLLFIDVILDFIIGNVIYNVCERYFMNLQRIMPITYVPTRSNYGIKSFHPPIRVGDSIRIVFYLEMPEDVPKGQKTKCLAFEGLVVAKHFIKERGNSTITLRGSCFGVVTYRLLSIDAP